MLFCGRMIRPHASPLPLSRPQMIYLSQSFCVSPVQLTDGRGGGDVRGAESYDRKKPWSSINNSIQSDGELRPSAFPPALDTSGGQVAWCEPGGGGGEGKDPVHCPVSTSLFRDGPPMPAVFRFVSCSLFLIFSSLLPLLSAAGRSRSRECRPAQAYAFLINIEGPLS